MVKIKVSQSTGFEVQSSFQDVKVFQCPVFGVQTTVHFNNPLSFITSYLKHSLLLLCHSWGRISFVAYIFVNQLYSNIINRYTENLKY